jgi:hypothetical protein
MISTLVIPRSINDAAESEYKIGLGSGRTPTAGSDSVQNYSRGGNSIMKNQDEHDRIRGRVGQGGSRRIH